MKKLILALIFQISILKNIYAISNDFISKMKSPNINLNISDECNLKYNNYYMIWMCEDKVGFILKKNFFANNYENSDPTEKMIFFKGKVSYLVFIDTFTYLLMPDENRIAIISNDDSGKFEKYYINLTDLLVVYSYDKKYISYEKFSVVRNGDYVTFSVLVKNKTQSFPSYDIFVFSIMDYYPISMRDKDGFKIYENQTFSYNSNANNMLIQQNLYSGYLNIILISNNSIDIYESGFETLNFKFNKSINFRKQLSMDPSDFIYETIFYENLIILKINENHLIIFKLIDGINEIKLICDIKLIEAKNISYFTITKNNVSYFSSQEYNLAFLDEKSNKLYIYKIIDFDQFYIQPLCYMQNEEFDIMISSVKSLEYLDIFDDFNKHFRYLFIRSPIFDYMKVLGLVSYCFTNEYYSNLDGCKICEKGFFSIKSENSYCENSCDIISNQKENNVLYNYTYMINCPAKNNCSSQMSPFISPSFNFSDHYSWGLTEKNFCYLNCKDNSLQLIENQCLNKNSIILFEDYCQKFSDCYNCSISHGCIWCDNTCQNIKKAETCEFQKDLRMTDNFWKFDRCERLPICGKQSMIFDSDGEIKLENFDNRENNVYLINKNSVCSWEIFTIKGYLSDYIFYYIRILVQSGFFVNNSTKLPKMTFCLFNKENVCFTWPLHLNFPDVDQSYKVFYKRFKIMLHFPEDILVDNDKFQIKYQKHQEFYIDFTNMFGEWIFISLISILFMICCIFLLKSISLSIRGDSNIPLLRRLEFQLYYFETHKNRLKRLLNEKIIIKEKFDGNLNINNFNQEECPFCLEKFKLEDELARCCCKHIFHFSCMEQWNKVEKRNVLRCPLCKEKLEKNSERGESENVDL